MEFLTTNRKATISAFKYKVHEELNVNTTKDQAYKTFGKAKILIHGKYKQQYTRIWDYCEELLSLNPSSTVHVETEVDENNGKERFQRLYICFVSLKKGFKEGCRPVLRVDDCCDDWKIHSYFFKIPSYFD